MVILYLFVSSKCNLVVYLKQIPRSVDIPVHNSSGATKHFWDDVATDVLTV